ncbi:hypothetical protein DDZ18_08815 [Marinicauda salina]|uniref:HTH luxR-type domain-containing protein n=1 Tax=Marinicauda salina TaxID=2135793 RepID=A0A2U2BUN7_9PROT|nr:response regulator transcription factor [Marinicauda salina]PWE17745.1 hypothetical protein DDZ18_08815 [Marinicauda salina]
MTGAERARLRRFLTVQAARAAVFLGAVFGLAASLVWIATVPGRPLAGPWLLAPALLGLWIVLFRDAPGRLVAAWRDLKAGRVESATGPAELRRARAPGLVGPERTRLRLGERWFDLDETAAGKLAPGTRIDVRYAPLSGALLGLAPEPAPGEADLADPPAAGLEALTAREQRLLGLIGRGLSDKEIARELNLSPATVRSYNSTLYAKLGVANRTQAAACARRPG